MAKFLNPTVLTADQHEKLLEACFEIQPIFNTAQTMGFRNKSGFQKYLNRNPEFWAEVKQARIDACDFIEDELLQIPEKYDFKMAKHVIDIYCRVLAFRVPAKYSQRIDMNINQNVSITHNLINANSRMDQMIKSVAPLTKMIGD